MIASNAIVSIEAYGDKVSIDLYTKMYIEEKKTYDLVVVISFHEEGMID